MKSYQAKLITGLTVVLVSVTLFSQSSFGQDAIGALLGTEQKLSQLIDSQNRIADLLNDLSVKQQPTDPSISSLVSVTTPNGCLSNLGSPSSTYDPPDEWNFDFVRIKSINGDSWNREIMQDLNGDGLLDYIIISTGNQGGGKGHSSCVYLNDGDSFEKQYACVAAKSGSNPWEYYGDCAG